MAFLRREKNPLMSKNLIFRTLFPRIEALRRGVNCYPVRGITNVHSYYVELDRALVRPPFSSRSTRYSAISIPTSLTGSVLSSLDLAISDTLSILGSFGALRRPGFCEARPCFIETYIFRGDEMCLRRGFKGGKHAASKPIDTSAVVQKVGGVVL